MKKKASKGTAWNSVLKLLAGSDKSASQLKARLTEKGFGLDEIDEVLERLRSHRLLNEDEAAKRVVAKGIGNRRGRTRIAFELTRQGFCAESASAALSLVTPEMEEESMRLAAEKFWRRSSSRPLVKRMKSLANLLVRSGFESARVFDFIEKWQTHHAQEDCESSC
ncbi:MAG: hypothetical protein A2Y02_01580 [Omnitrophica bacterium GWA2_52_12]|nr:MAG: hypothetical protein A2Y02_01580 [Omnitrophica bacterium GWA2_52_12]